MEHADAVALIRNGVPKTKAPTRWADLGCGGGTFTKALAGLLSEKSIIVAIDREHHNILSPNPSVAIEFQRGDFTLRNSVPIDLDGMLIANALHYVSDQQSVLQQLFSHLKPGGRIIIVEYDTDRANQWVPYPITFRKLSELLSGAGFRGTEKIGERNSVYRSDKIYSVVATV